LVVFHGYQELQEGVGDVDGPSGWFGAGLKGF
jgi:hypothetical protein